MTKTARVLPRSLTAADRVLSAHQREPLAPHHRIASLAGVSVSTTKRWRPARSPSQSRAAEGRIGKVSRKHCRKCGETKPLTEFDRCQSKSDGRQTACRPCRQERYEAHGHLRYRYGITPEQYAALWDRQGGKCAGCGAAECPTGNRLAIDHDHTCCPPKDRKGRTRGACGKCVRALLCATCNRRDVMAGQPYVDWSSLDVQRYRDRSEVTE